MSSENLVQQLCSTCDRKGRRALRESGKRKLRSTCNTAKAWSDGICFGCKAQKCSQCHWTIRSSRSAVLKSSETLCNNYVMRAPGKQGSASYAPFATQPGQLLAGNVMIAKHRNAPSATGLCVLLIADRDLGMQRSNYVTRATEMPSLFLRARFITWT